MRGSYLGLSGFLQAILMVLSLGSIPGLAQTGPDARSDEGHNWEGASLADLRQRALPAIPLAVLPPPEAVHHAFWDRNNCFLFAGVGAMRALDYASTRNMQARGREEILLPDDVVNNSAGFAALEASATALSIALSYWMHRTAHHKIERWISIVHISVAGFGNVRNYALDSKHPAPLP